MAHTKQSCTLPCNLVQSYKSQIKSRLPPMALVVVLLFSLLLLPLGEAQIRPMEAHPHGLPFESPLALSPAAFEFFHPGMRPHTRPGHAIAPELAPHAQLAESAVRGASAGVARADEEEGSTLPAKPVRGGFRAGAVTVIVVGVGTVVLVAFGVAYVVARRRVNVNHADGDVEAAEEK